MVGEHPAAGTTEFLPRFCGGNPGPETGKRDSSHRNQARSERPAGQRRDEGPGAAPGVPKGHDDLLGGTARVARRGIRSGRRQKPSGSAVTPGTDGSILIIS